MSFEVTAENAEIYFSETNHVMAYDWANFTENERAAGLAHGVRNIQSRLGREIELPEEATEVVREDLACYEQALFNLLSFPRTNRGVNSAQVILPSAGGDNAVKYDVGIAPEAYKFLGVIRRTVERA